MNIEISNLSFFFKVTKEKKVKKKKYFSIRKRNYYNSYRIWNIYIKIHNVNLKFQCWVHVIVIKFWDYLDYTEVLSRSFIIMKCHLDVLGWVWEECVFCEIFIIKKFSFVLLIRGNLFGFWNKFGENRTLLFYLVSRIFHWKSLNLSFTTSVLKYQ